MTGILYIALSYLTGYILIKSFLPCLFNISNTISLFRKPVNLCSWMIYIPAAYLTGTMVLTWTTYLVSYLFRNTETPLLWGNMISMGMSIAFIAFSALMKRDLLIALVKNLKNTRIKHIPKLEIIFTAISVLIASFLMFYTFNIRNGNMHVGVSVFSDFGPHLALIRSFSSGSNFPTQYPHFPDGTIRYHFMFQFLAGDLEFLGLRLDWAFNLPSILSLVSLFMLFYSFTVVIFGEKIIGAIAAVLFFFRSSYASLSFITDLKSSGQPLSAIIKNETFIGKTAHEDWGLFAQNVYVNQRHFAFALALMMLALIILVPLFKKMVFALQDIKNQTLKKKNIKHNNKFRTEFLLNADAWLPYHWKTAVSLGVLLGLMGFFNGAVLISTLLILFGLSIFSKHRLDYAITAAIALIIFSIEVKFFIKTGSPVGQSNLIFLGFLANIPADLAGIANSYISAHKYFEVIKLLPALLKYIVQYYIELLGVLPAIVIIALFTFSGKRKLYSALIITPLLAAYFLFNPTRNVDLQYIVLILLVVLASTIILIASKSSAIFPKGTRRLIAAFSLPLLMATTLQLTPDIAVNHKYVMISAMLLSIVAAYYLYTLFKTRGTAVLALILMVALISSGVIDLITLINKDSPSKSIVYNNNDPVTIWAENYTDPKAVFLTDTSVINPILLAGRNIYYGWPYFAWSAGYDTDFRENIANQIYGAAEEKQLKALTEKYGVDYIVIDNENRIKTSYKLNEKLISKAFLQVYSGNDVIIFRTH